MGLVRIGDAARLLRLDPTSLRRRESPDGHWVILDPARGIKIRVHRTGTGSGAQRLYDAGEIRRILPLLRTSAR
jgi:hypothetical protein